jgi:hypothetical protein
MSGRSTQLPVVRVMKKEGPTYCSGSAPRARGMKVYGWFSHLAVECLGLVVGS